MYVCSPYQLTIVCTVMTTRCEKINHHLNPLAEMENGALRTLGLVAHLPLEIALLTGLLACQALLLIHVTQCYLTLLNIEKTEGYYYRGIFSRCPPSSSRCVGPSQGVPPAARLMICTLRWMTLNDKKVKKCSVAFGIFQGWSIALEQGSILVLISLRLEQHWQDWGVKLVGLMRRGLFHPSDWSMMHVASKKIVPVDLDCLIRAIII